LPVQALFGGRTYRLRLFKAVAGQIPCAFPKTQVFLCRLLRHECLADLESRETYNYTLTATTATQAGAQTVTWLRGDINESGDGVGRMPHGENIKLGRGPAWPRFTVR